MKPQRSVVNMPAVAAPAKRTARMPMSPARVKELAVMATLVVGVTAGGVALGVYGVSPLIEGVSMERLRDLSDRLVAKTFEVAANVVQQPDVLIALGITAVAAIAAYVGVGVWKKRAPNRGAPVASAQTTMTFTARTPRDVQVLAAAGRKPAEIAARTRLPVDAVSMLLNLGQAQ